MVKVRGEQKRRMGRIKRFLAITLLAAVAGLGMPAAAAEGSAESPGMTTEQSGITSSASLEGNAEAPGYLGGAESPGLMATVLIYLDVII
jgi:hypothetical protein